MNYAYLPNILSLVRILLAGMMFYYVHQASWLMAALILWLSIFSDFLDGFLARKFDTVSNLGGLLDHGSDAIFVSMTIAALTFHDFAPPALAIIIPAAFLQYMLDSKTLSGRPLRASYLGRYNGIAYYVFSGLPIMQIALDITLIPFDSLIWIGWILVLSTTISMINRLATLLSNWFVDK